MNKLTSRGVSWSFKTLFTLVLMVLVARVSDARVDSSKSVAQQSGALTYTGTILHTFDPTDGTRPADGAEPLAGLVADSSGNLYGTTDEGGTQGVGTVFELTPDGQGGWTYKEIYSAIGGVAIAIDSQGNLYVTVDIASGDIFELSPVAGGTWVVSHVYGFTGTYDGSDSTAPVIVDANGDVYGTTLNGAYGCGAVFELIPFGNQWLEQTLHIFTCGGGAPGPDGAYPEGSLIMDRAGNLYGTTAYGGTGNGQGVVFKLHLTANGWKETVLYNFQGGPNDGAYPQGNLIMDRAGNLYGITSYGFSSDPSKRGTGGVYKLTPKGQITWLYVFTGGADGGWPGAGLVFDQEGNLYGTSNGGASTQPYCSGGCGSVFELTPPQNNGTTTWTENVLYSVDGGTTGWATDATPYLDPAGNIYVTFVDGGNVDGISGDGTILELKPNPAPTTVTIAKNSPSPSATGQVVTVSFAVSQSVRVTYKPTGTVSVNASTGEACLVALPASGKSSCQLMFLSAGTRTLTAIYSGDAKDQSSVSGVATQTVVNLTTTAITKNTPDPAKVGKTVTVHFSVEANGAAKHTKPTGSVTVNASTGESCTGTLSAGGNGSCELAFSTAGSRTLTAIYAGDGDNAPSASTATTETVE